MGCRLAPNLGHVSNFRGLKRTRSNHHNSLMLNAFERGSELCPSRAGTLDTSRTDVAKLRVPDPRRVDLIPLTSLVCDDCAAMTIHETLNTIQYAFGACSQPA